MTILYTKVFSCNDCNADIHGRIYSNDTLSDQDQGRYLEDLKQSHFDSLILNALSAVRILSDMKLPKVYHMKAR